MSDFSAGIGIDASFLKQKNEDFDIKVQENQREYTVELDAHGNKKFESTPSIPKQYSMPGYWKYGDATSEVFNLSDPEQLKKYNRILATGYDQDPGLEVISMKVDFYRGIYSAFVIWRPILYAVIIKHI